MAKVQRKKREKFTEQMLVKQIKNLKHSDTTMAAATASDCSYPTFLARFRRIGLSVESVQGRLNKGESPEHIAASVFRKRNRRVKQKAVSYRTKSLQELQKHLQGVLKEINQTLAQQVPAPA